MDSQPRWSKLLIALYLSFIFPGCRIAVHLPAATHDSAASVSFSESVNSPDPSPSTVISTPAPATPITVNPIPGGPITGQIAVWQNVTPAGKPGNPDPYDRAGVQLDPSYEPPNNNFGVQDVIADPIHAGVFYAFVCYQGVWKSTDWGLNWDHISVDGNLECKAQLETGPRSAGTTGPWARSEFPNLMRLS